MTIDENDAISKNFARFYLSLSNHSAIIRYPVLFAEAICLTCLAFAMSLVFGIKGLEFGVFSLFLTAISLHYRFDFLLDEHRQNIFERGIRPFRAHLITAYSLMALYIGMCAAYLLLVSLLSTDDVNKIFSFVADISGLNSGTWLSGRFSSIPVLVTHNLGVAAVITLLCVFYRSYGAVLVFGWNVCIWVVTLSMLTRRTVEAHPGDPAFINTISALAIFPHMCLELSAYILASLAGIFISKSLTRYIWDDLKVFEILKSAIWILGASGLTITAAAFVEFYFPKLMFNFL